MARAGKGDRATGGTSPRPPQVRTYLPSPLLMDVVVNNMLYLSMLIVKLILHPWSQPLSLQLQAPLCGPGHAQDSVFIGPRYTWGPIYGSRVSETD